MDFNNDSLLGDDRLNIVSEFAQFLEHGNNGIEEILQHLNRKSFAALGASSVHFTRLNSFNKLELEMELRSGVFIPKEFATSRYLEVDRKLPIVDVFNSGKILWINTLPDWGVDYPLLKDYPIDLHGKTFIGVPILQEGVTKGVLSIICEPKLFESDGLDNFFMAITGLLSLQLARL